MGNSLVIKVIDNTEQFFFAHDDSFAAAVRNDRIPLSCDDLGHVLGLLLELDYRAVFQTIAQYKWNELENHALEATNREDVYQRLLSISEVFKLYSAEDAFSIMSHFRHSHPTVPYLVQRLKAYMDFCEQRQLPYQNDFYDYLKENHYFGQDVLLYFSDGFPHAKEYFYECNADARRRDNLDAHYEFFLNEAAAHNNTTPRAYHILENDNRLVETAMASFEELARRKKTLRKCANCGRYFVPENRSDTRYCDRISPQEPTMDCKTYASQRLWYQKQKRDELAVLSRNILSAKGMLAKRNPDIPAYQRSYDYFRAERLTWKKAVETGEATRDAYREWLLKMQEQKIIKEAFDGID